MGVTLVTDTQGKSLSWTLASGEECGFKSTWMWGHSRGSLVLLMMIGEQRGTEGNLLDLAAEDLSFILLENLVV